MSEGEREEWLHAVVRELRRPVRVRPEFDRRVMSAVRAERPRRRGWTISVTLSPLRAVGLAASLAGMTVGGAWLLSRQMVEPARTLVQQPAAATHAVQFVFVAPRASRVALVGDFNDWSSTATPMQPAAVGGVWSVTVPLPTGRYQYAFVVDGREWRPDPAAPTAPVDDFGARNSVVTVADRTL